jgi:pimeloyl-ACP methyl ester carboxylesterase
MSKILTISGWGQGEGIVSQNLNFDSEYLTLYNYQFSELLSFVKENFFDVIIGWSLGGQVALRLADECDIKKLILISTPFKFVDEEFGVREKVFLDFQKKLEENSDKLLADFSGLISFGDKKFKEVKDKLKACDATKETLQYWLKFLGEFKAQENLSEVETLLIYGEKDVVVNVEQGKKYRESLKNSNLEIFKGCAHAPFLSEREKFNRLVGEFVEK